MIQQTKFLKRGSGPLVSVLLPTRRRPIHLCEAIDSIHSLAKNKSNVEFLLKIDDDDTDTISVAEQLSKVLPLRSIVSPRGNGYNDMHLWVNQMSSLAVGDWLFLFNDDARMKTQDWDEFLEKFTIIEGRHWCRAESDIVLFNAQTIGRINANEFPFVRKNVVEVLGHYSLSPCNDLWINEVMSLAKAKYDFPYIEVEHKDTQIQDETRSEVSVAYEDNSRTMWASSSIRARIADALKLVDYMDSVAGDKMGTLVGS